jgi:PPOX class probable F420-dependent enzyme
MHLLTGADDEGLLMTAPFGQAGTAKYVLLTTFRKDGDKLLMWTVTDSWKVKRLRRDPAVVVQACDVRGKQTYGDPVSGTAEILDDAGSDRARAVVQKKYGILGWVTVKGSVLRRGKSGSVGLAITADAV